MPAGDGDGQSGFIFGSVLRGLVGDGLIYGLGASLNGLVTLALIPFLVRRLTAAEYGRFALAEGLISVLLTIQGLGLGIALLAQYPGANAERRRRLTGLAFSMAIASGAVSGAILIIIIRHWGQAFLPSLGQEMAALVCAVCFVENLWMLFGTVFRAEGRAHRYVALSLLQAIIEFVIIVTFVPSARHKPELLIWARLAGDAGQLALVSPAMAAYRPRLDWQGARALASFGVPLVPAVLSSSWLAMFPRFLLDRLGSPADVGSFAISSKLAAVLSLGFVQPFAMAWMVVIFQIYRRTDAKAVYSKIFTYYSLVGITLALGLALIAPVIASWLGRKAFPISPGITTILSCAAVAAGAFHPLNVGPYVMRQTRRVLPACGAATAASIVLGYCLVRAWRVEGGALASLLVYTLQAALIARVSQSLYPIRPEWRRICIAICVPILMFIFMRLAGTSPSLVGAMGALITFLLGVGLVLLLLGFFTADERQTARHLTRVLFSYAASLS